MRTIDPPASLRTAAADWAVANVRPGEPERTWSARLERELQPRIRSAVLAAVRRENRRAFAVAALAGLAVVAVAALVVLGAVTLLRLETVAAAVVAAVGALVATIVVARLMRRVRTGERYASRVLEVHRELAAAAVEAARAALGSAPLGAADATDTAAETEGADDDAA